MIPHKPVSSSKIRLPNGGWVVIKYSLCDEGMEIQWKSISKWVDIPRYLAYREAGLLTLEADMNLRMGSQYCIYHLGAHFNKGVVYKFPGNIYSYLKCINCYILTYFTDSKYIIEIIVIIDNAQYLFLK